MNTLLESGTVNDENVPRLDALIHADRRFIVSTVVAMVNIICSFDRAKRVLRQ